MNLSSQTSCPPYFDGFLKWPETEANRTIFQDCPIRHEMIKDAKVHRYCHTSGRWADRFRQPTDNLTQSFTNFTACLEEIPELTDITSKYVPYLSIGGLILGTLTLSISVFILIKYRYLMNYRTKIHKQLFIALLCESVIQLSMYIDLVRVDPGNATLEAEDDRRPLNILCNLRICVYEYFITTVFFWMLVEGVHIHNIIAVNVFHTRYWFNCYLFIGWLIPLPITITWLVFMVANNSQLTRKWEKIHLNPLFWIMASARLLCVVINIIFLINVIRILVLKLRANNSSDICQAKTAIKAAVLLIPLLGVVNFVQMVNFKMGTIEFEVLSVFQAILPAYQGLLVSIVFCLINKDVRLAVSRSYRKYRTRKSGNRGLRMKTATWDSRHRQHYNQNTVSSNLFSNNETKIHSEE